MAHDGGSERTVEFEPLDHELSRDLWERSRCMREECPVAWSEAQGGFWVGRHLAAAELRFVIEELSQLARLDVETDGIVYRAGFVRAPEPLIVTASQ